MPRSDVTLRLRHVAAAALLVLAATGCDVAGRATGHDEPQPAKACDTRPLPPIAEWSKVVYITASAQSTCDVAPASHQVRVWLEEYVQSQWVQAAGPRGDAYATCIEIPPSGEWIRCDYAYYQCRPGRWRTRVLVTGSGPTGQAFSFEPPERPETLIKSCPTG